MKETMKFFVVIVLLFAFESDLCSQTFSLGVNLDNNGAFVNMMKHTNRFQKAVGYDNSGYPTSDFDLVLMDARPVAEWAGQIDDPEGYRVDVSGQYKSSFTGQANITVSGTAVTVENKTYDSQSNTTFFTIVVGGYPNANHGLVFLSFTNTRRTPADELNTGITNIKIHRPGYEVSTDKIFTDEFIRLCTAADFSCYRFYNVQNIWQGEPVFPAVTSWNMRKLPSDVTQQPINGKKDGWCWEYIIELANILKKDIWINIHISCDSVYVTTLANFLKERLNHSINIYVENSNEVWSPTHETEGPYNNAQAKQYGITFDENYARRSVELSRWFANVYGENAINSKIRVVLAGQHAYNGRSDNHLNYINKTFGEPKKYIYATSTALYFQSAQANGNPDEINNGMITDIQGQMENKSASTYRLNHIDKAKKWGLIGGCTSYEGGPHLPSGGGNNNLANQILSHRTEKMGDVTRLNYEEGWKELNGGLAMYFTLVSGYNRYGCWGITDDYTKPERNYKMKAMRDIIGTPSDIGNEEFIKEIKVFPNPTNNNITIQLPLSVKEAVLQLTDIMGRSISGIRFSGDTYTLPTSGLSDGVYFLQYKTKDLVKKATMFTVQHY